MQKMLFVDAKRCTGCRMCEVVCSASHGSGTNPAKSRIHVIKWEWEGLMIPMFCQQCKDAPCIVACPVKALYRDEEYGRVIVDTERCIGCKLCIAVCPFGGMGWDSEENRVIKCDFCDGDPACVRFCSTQAIRFVDASEVSLEKKREVVKIFPDIMIGRDEIK